MKRIIRPEILQNPAAHALDHLGIIHIGGDDQGRHLKPDPHISKDFEGRENGFEGPAV